MPPTLLSLLATPFWYFAHSVIFWNWWAATTAFAGGLLGYVCYDMTHYFLHHRKYVAFFCLLLGCQDANMA
jgi:4-hydroxysphinganine ceramide fatty acyl 2-hydroxylase